MKENNNLHPVEIRRCNIRRRNILDRTQLAFQRQVLFRIGVLLHHHLCHHPSARKKITGYLIKIKVKICTDRVY